MSHRNQDKAIMLIKYEIEETTGICLTPCPKNSKGSFGTDIMVGSMCCEQCREYGGEENNAVICNSEA